VLSTFFLQIGGVDQRRSKEGLWDYLLSFHHSSKRQLRSLQD